MAREVTSGDRLWAVLPPPTPGEMDRPETRVQKPVLPTKGFTRR